MLELATRRLREAALALVCLIGAQLRETYRPAEWFPQETRIRRRARLIPGDEVGCAIPNHVMTSMADRRNVCRLGNGFETQQRVGETKQEQSFLSVCRRACPVRCFVASGPLSASRGAVNVRQCQREAVSAPTRAKNRLWLARMRCCSSFTRVGSAAG